MHNKGMLEIALFVDLGEDRKQFLNEKVEWESDYQLIL